MSIKDKFKPLTEVKPSDNPDEEINLKEKDLQAEPSYLEDEPVADTPKTAKAVEPPAAVKSEKPLEPTSREETPSAMESTADYANYEKPEKPKKGHKWLILVLLLLVAAGAVYWFMLKPKPTAKTTAASTPATAQSSTSATLKDNAASTVTKVSATTKSFTSSNFNLAFSYPDNWTVTDTGSGVLTAKSPSMQLKNASNAAVTGQVVLTIRNTAQKLSEFDAGSASATRDSVKIAYAKPTQTQRGSTYVSFLQYAATTGTGGLDSVFITGDSGYKKAQTIPKTDISKVDPKIAITFIDASGKALTVADSMWDDTGISDPLMNMLKSFSIN